LSESCNPAPLPFPDSEFYALRQMVPEFRPVRRR
jgi:hypothetical protein